MESEASARATEVLNETKTLAAEYSACYPKILAEYPKWTAIRKPIALADTIGKRVERILAAKKPRQIDVDRVVSNLEELRRCIDQARALLESREAKSVVHLMSPEGVPWSTAEELRHYVGLYEGLPAEKRATIVYEPERFNGGYGPRRKLYRAIDTAAGNTTPARHKRKADAPKTAAAPAKKKAKSVVATSSLVQDSEHLAGIDEMEQLLGEEGGNDVVADISKIADANDGRLPLERYPAAERARIQALYEYYQTQGGRIGAWYQKHREDESAGTFDIRCFFPNAHTLHGLITSLDGKGCSPCPSPSWYAAGHCYLCDAAREFADLPSSPTDNLITLFTALLTAPVSPPGATIPPPEHTAFIRLLQQLRTPERTPRVPDPQSGESKDEEQMEIDPRAEEDGEAPGGEEQEEGAWSLLRARPAPPSVAELVSTGCLRVRALLEYLATDPLNALPEQARTLVQRAYAELPGGEEGDDETKWYPGLVCNGATARISDKACETQEEAQQFAAQACQKTTAVPIAICM